MAIDAVFMPLVDLQSITTAERFKPALVPINFATYISFWTFASVLTVMVSSIIINNINIKKMKTSSLSFQNFKSLTVAALFFFSFSAAKAGTDENNSSKKAAFQAQVLKGFSEKQIKVAFQSEMPKTVTIRIKDEKNELLFKRKVRAHSKYLNLFDLNDLPQGSYTFEISSEDGNFTKTITL